MWHFETWFSGGLSSNRLMAGLKDLIGLFNLNDSMTLIYSKDKRKGTLSIGRKSYFSQGKEKKIGYAVQ